MLVSTGARLQATRPRARGDLLDRPVERLEAEVIHLAARMAAGTYELLVLVGELDERGSWPRRRVRTGPARSRA